MAKSRSVSRVTNDKIEQIPKVNNEFESMRKGYKEMAAINLALSDLYFQAESEAQSYYDRIAELSPVIGSEQGGIRPVLVVQNDVGNKFSPTVICAAITSKINKAKLPTHVEINAAEYELVKNSVILLEQIRTIDKRRLKEKICHLDENLMLQVDKGIKVSFALNT